MSKYRHKESRHKRKRSFGKHARKTHKKNIPRMAMRGGVRL